MDTKQFAKNLRTLLKIFDMTQVDFAKQAGIPSTYVSLLLRGKTMPSINTFMKIMKIFPVKFEKWFQVNAFRA